MIRAQVSVHFRDIAIIGIEECFVEETNETIHEVEQE